MTYTLEAAIDYWRRGWSIIPILPCTKNPARRWTKYQTNRAGEGQLRAWFDNGSDYGVAVIFGPVSDGLASRDYDDMDGYERWAAKYPDLAGVLPTVETARGRHVYFRAAPGSVEEVRDRLGKPGTGMIKFGDGELRTSIGCFSLVPPSRHPGGHVYRWLIPPGDEIPVIDAAFFGAPFNREVREYREVREVGGGQTTVLVCGVVGGDFGEVIRLGGESTPVLESDGQVETSPAPSTPSCQSSDDLSPYRDQIERAIAVTAPVSTGSRHKLVFELARQLKAIPGLADLPLASLKPIVRQWYIRALPFTKTTSDDTWFDFAEGWERVRYPAGQEPIAMSLAKAIEAEARGELPEVAKQYEQRELRLLVAFCRELQRDKGTEPFFLATRTAGKLLGIEQSTASLWLRALRRDGILDLVTKGSQSTRKASRFRYLEAL